MKRGFDRADIYSIVFSPDSEWLAVSSDKGTVHVFHINVCSPSSSKTGCQDTTQSYESYGAKAMKKYVSSIKGNFNFETCLLALLIVKGKLYFEIFVYYFISDSLMILICFQIYLH